MDFSLSPGGIVVERASPTHGRGTGWSRIYGLDCGASRPRANLEFARRVPIAAAASKARACQRDHPGGGPTALPCVQSSLRALPLTGLVLAAHRWECSTAPSSRPRDDDAGPEIPQTEPGGRLQASEPAPRRPASRLDRAQCGVPSAGTAWPSLGTTALAERRPACAQKREALISTSACSQALRKRRRTSSVGLPCATSASSSPLSDQPFSGLRLGITAPES